jgi:hypothetical protein
MTALLFPPTPSDGDTYEGYIYNAAKNVWQWQVIDPSVESLSDTVITTPSAGQALVYDGTDWVNSSGNILQVVQTVKTDVFTESVSTGGVTGDAMVATITPTSASSKIMVSVQYSATVNASAVLHAYLFRNAAVSAYIGDAVGSRARASTSSPGAGVSAGFAPSGSILYLDSPATTSATTYSIRFGHASAVNLAIYLNRSDADNNDNQRARYASSITLMEVAD